MNLNPAAMAKVWMHVSTRFLPFADAATPELPIGRLLRLSMFQVSVGMAFVLLNGTLNRVMIVELGVPSSLVAFMVALPLVFAPLRVLIGFRSDHHRSFLGWKRVPYIWMGSLLQFGGLAIMPFSLLILSGDTHGPVIIGHIGAALAFLLVGAGLHSTHTAGLALATVLAPDGSRPRVVAFLYVMLLVGMIASSVIFGALLRDFNAVLLIQVIQGAAVATMVLNVVALWKQEVRDPSRTPVNRPQADFWKSWTEFRGAHRSTRVMLAVGLGTAGFAMQDILLEPYGAEVLSLTVSQTTMLTALLAGGMLLGFTIAAQMLVRGYDPYRLAAIGAIAGLIGFSFVIFAAPMQSIFVFRIGTGLIGFGGGLFAVCTLTAAMEFARGAHAGMALGAWGAVQATAAGGGIALGGAVRDVIGALASHGYLGRSMTDPSIGYSVVYHIEIALLFATLVAIGPLVRPARAQPAQPSTKFGLAQFPG